MPLDRVKANELLELVVIDQSPKARKLLLDKLEECMTPDPALNRIRALALENQPADEHICPDVILETLDSE